MAPDAQREPANAWPTRPIGVARHSMRRGRLPPRQLTSCARRCRVRSSTSTWLAAIGSASPIVPRCSVSPNEQLQRMATSLSAVRALADAEFADPLVVRRGRSGRRGRRGGRRRAPAQAPTATIEIGSTPPTTDDRVARRRAGWRSPTSCATRLVHGVPADGSTQRCRRVGRRVHGHGRRQRPGHARGGSSTGTRTVRARRWPWIGAGSGDRTTGGNRARRFGADRVELARWRTRGDDAEPLARRDGTPKTCWLTRPRSTRGRGG